MKRFSVAISLALVIGVLMPSTASALTFRETVPLQGEVPLCSGELVTVSGELLVTGHVIEDSAGGVHAHGTVTGRHIQAVSESGTHYRVVWVGTNTFNVSGQGTITLTEVFRIKLITEGGTDNALLQVAAHITITPAGVLTVSFERGTDDCVG